jgi:hypothetical protein
VAINISDAPAIFINFARQRCGAILAAVSTIGTFYE